MEVKKKCVRFSQENTIIPVPNDEDRLLGYIYYRGLINKCCDTHKEIAKIIKPVISYKFNNIKVLNSNLNWSDDDSPFILFERLQNKDYLFNFCDGLNKCIKNELEINNKGHKYITYYYENIYINIVCV